MRGEFGHEIPPAPETLDGVAVFTRFLDGLAFRYYWTTEGLRAEDYEFRPGPSSMSTFERMRLTEFATSVGLGVLFASRSVPFREDDVRENGPDQTILRGRSGFRCMVRS